MFEAKYESYWFCLNQELVNRCVNVTVNTLLYYCISLLYKCLVMHLHIEIGLGHHRNACYCWKENKTKYVVACSFISEIHVLTFDLPSFL